MRRRLGGEAAENFLKNSFETHVDKMVCGRV